jgi:hypothetical protein
MHRSGTSALTRGLSVLGVDIGANLLAPEPGSNDTGFWEDLHVQALNVDLMSSLGYRWDSLKPLEPGLLTGPHVAPYLDRACAIIREKTLVRAIVGIKDPRMSQLLPFWLEVFGRLELPVGVVIALRNPMAVARSLQRRDGLDITKSAYLWLLHMYRAVHDSRGLPRLVVQYDDILAQPREQLARIAAVLHLRAPEAADEALREYEDHFLDRALQRTHGSLADLEKDARVPPVVGALYRLLLRASTGDADLEGREAMACLGQVAAALADLEPLLTFAGRKDAECLTLASPTGRRQVLFQVFPHVAGSYAEANVASVLVDVGGTQHVVMELPQGSPTGAIRVDPANVPCVVHLDRIVVKRLADGAVIASWVDPSETRSLSPVTDLFGLPGDQGVRFLITGGDPQFLLPDLGPAVTAQPLILETWMRVDPQFTPALASLLAAGEREINRLRLDQQDLRATLEVVYGSRSWRATAPLRRLAHAVRGVGRVVLEGAQSALSRVPGSPAGDSGAAPRA